MTNRRLNELYMKQLFARRVGNAISIDGLTSVKKIDYKAYELDNKIIEYLLIYLIGSEDEDVIIASDCTGDSVFALLDEIARLVPGGCYDGLAGYVEIKSKAVEIGLL